MMINEESPTAGYATAGEENNVNTDGERLALFQNHFKKLVREHGLSGTTILKAGFYSASAAELNELLGRRDINCNGIVIPYDCGGYYRARLDTPLELRNGKTAKYLSPSGSKNRLYIPQATKGVLKDVSVPLYITEGEFKAAKLTQEGFHCLGLSGVWGFSRDKKLLPDFDDIEMRGRKVIVILDSDAKEKLYHDGN